MPLRLAAALFYSMHTIHAVQIGWMTHRFPQIAASLTLQYTVAQFSSCFLQMPCNVFTYGSLMFPGVWEQVVHGRYSSVKAVLAHHARYALAEESYPGMVVQSGAVVEGLLYLDVDAADVARLDAFEGIDYRRTAVRVQVPDGAEIEAQTYLYTLPQRLLKVEWEADKFDMDGFLRIYRPNLQLPS